jgi:hypothetical protein
MKPPLSALWLMNRFGVDEALAGDLAKQAGRSPLWLWQQVVGALAIAILKDFRAHWILALRAGLLGPLLCFLCPFLAFRIWTGYVGARFASLASLVGVEHPNVHTVTAAFNALAVPGWFCVGWLVARLHRTRTPAPVLAAVFATWLLSLPDYSRQFSNALGDPRFRPYFVMEMVRMSLLSLSVLAGGLWSIKNQQGMKLRR